MRLTAHGGVNEIGGNKVLLEAGGGSLWLDFGLSFGAMKDYYCEFCQPRPWSFVGDQVALGLLPDLAGLYRDDLLSRMGRAEGGSPAQQAAFFSHAHMDHVGMVPAMRPDLRLHVSAATRAVLSSIDASGGAVGAPDTFLDFTRKFKLVEAKKGGLKRATGAEAREGRAVRTFVPGEEVMVAPDLAVVPVAVDHSLPGASAFIVHADGRTLAYTGDLRFHGRHAERSERFVDLAASEGVDVLVTEGTRVTEPRGTGEEEVTGRVSKLVEGCRGLVLANYPARDLDRIITFHEAASRAGRDLVVSLQQALLLDELRTAIDEPVPRLGDHLRVFASRQRWGVVGVDAFPPEIQQQDYDTWERPYVASPHAVLDTDVREEQDRFVLFLNFFHLQALVDLRPAPGSIFIRSMVEPFDEDMMLDEERVRSWMRRFGLEVHQCHASGHASGPDLERLVRTIAPKVVVPVHTEHPEAFEAMHPNVRRPALGLPMDL
jgi:ribonuclease J